MYIYNNTISRGGIYITGSSTSINCINNIIWNNAASSSANGQPIYAAAGAITVAYSNVYEGISITAGVVTIYYKSSNINSDPQFTDVPNNDSHILQGSPCVDSGADTLSPPSTDFDGNPTNQNGDNDETNEYDIGAFEFLQDSLQYTSGAFQNSIVNNFKSSDNNTIAGMTTA